MENKLNEAYYEENPNWSNERRKRHRKKAFSKAKKYAKSLQDDINKAKKRLNEKEQNELKTKMEKMKNKKIAAGVALGSAAVLAGGVAASKALKKRNAKKNEENETVQECAIDLLIDEDTIYITESDMNFLLEACDYELNEEDILTNILESLNVSMDFIDEFGLEDEDTDDVNISEAVEVSIDNIVDKIRSKQDIDKRDIQAMIRQTQKEKPTRKLIFQLLNKVITVAAMIGAPIYSLTAGKKRLTKKLVSNRVEWDQSDMDIANKVKHYTTRGKTVDERGVSTEHKKNYYTYGDVYAAKQLKDKMDYVNYLHDRAAVRSKDNAVFSFFISACIGGLLNSLNRYATNADTKEMIEIYNQCIKRINQELKRSKGARGNTKLRQLKAELSRRRDKISVTGVTYTRDKETKKVYAESTQDDLRLDIAINLSESLAELYNNRIELNEEVNSMDKLNEEVFEGEFVEKESKDSLKQKGRNAIAAVSRNKGKVAAGAALAGAAVAGGVVAAKALKKRNAKKREDAKDLNECMISYELSEGQVFVSEEDMDFLLEACDYELNTATILSNILEASQEEINEKLAGAYRNSKRVADMTAKLKAAKKRATSRKVAKVAAGAALAGGAVAGGVVAAKALKKRNAKKNEENQKLEECLVDLYEENGQVFLATEDMDFLLEACDYELSEAEILDNILEATQEEINEKLAGAYRNSKRVADMTDKLKAAKKRATARKVGKVAATSVLAGTVAAGGVAAVKALKKRNAKKNEENQKLEECLINLYEENGQVFLALEDMDFLLEACDYELSEAEILDLVLEAEVREIIPGSGVKETKSSKELAKIKEKQAEDADEPEYDEFNESVEGDHLITEAILEDAGIALSEDELMSLISEHLLSERSIVRLDKAAKRSHAEKKALIVIAREQNDPLYKKLVKVYKQKNDILDKLDSKYGTRAAARVRKNTSKVMGKGEDK